MVSAEGATKEKDQETETDADTASLPSSSAAATLDILVETSSYNKMSKKARRGSLNSAKAERKKAVGIEEPDVNDVISGRGDTINRHPGNVQFRKLVDEKRRAYVSAHFKREKRIIAESIVDTIKDLNPPGRFLSKDARTGLWYSIEEDRAREKTSQALRENSKKLRKEIETDRLRRSSSESESTDSQRSSGQVSESKNPSVQQTSQQQLVGDGQNQLCDPHYPQAPSAAGWGYQMYYYGYGSQPPRVAGHPPPRSLSVAPALQHMSLATSPPHYVTCGPVPPPYPPGYPHVQTKAPNPGPSSYGYPSEAIPEGQFENPSGQTQSYGQPTSLPPLSVKPHLVKEPSSTRAGEGKSTVFAQNGTEQVVLRQLYPPDPPSTPLHYKVQHRQKRDQPSESHTFETSPTHATWHGPHKAYGGEQRHQQQPSHFSPPKHPQSPGGFIRSPRNLHQRQHDHGQHQQEHPQQRQHQKYGHPLPPASVGFRSNHHHPSQPPMTPADRSCVGALHEMFWASSNMTSISPPGPFCLSVPGDIRNTPLLVADAGGAMPFSPIGADIEQEFNNTTTSPRHRLRPRPSQHSTST